MEEKPFLIHPEFQGGPTYIQDGVEFGTLTPEQAIMFMLKVGASGYEFVNSDFITQVPNATMNTAVRIHGESYDHESALLGASETPSLDQPNIYKPQKVRRRKHDAYLRVRRITSHRSFNYANFVGSWKSRKLLENGLFEKWKSAGISSYFYNLVLLAPVQRQVGLLSVKGDYLSPRKEVSQVDGAYKLLAFEGEKQIKHRIIYTIPQLRDGQHLHILASGKKIKVSYSATFTDLDKQLQAIVAAINAVKWKNHSTKKEVALFKAEVADIESKKYLKVESTEQRRNVEFKMTITNKATVDWKLVLSGEVSGGIEIHEEQQGNLYGEPIAVDFLNMTELNQMKRDEKYNKLIDWYMSYSEAMDFYDDIEEINRKNVVSYFSPYMIRSLSRASLWAKNNYAGAAAEFKDALGINMRSHPKLNGSETFTAERGNLHMGVDQMSDISKVSTNYNWGREDIETKIDGALGFAWLYPHETVTNAMKVKDFFQPLDTYLDQFADAARIPLSVYKKLLEAMQNPS